MLIQLIDGLVKRWEESTDWTFDMHQEWLKANPREHMEAVRGEWIAHGLSTEPADRAHAEQGMINAYRAAGLEPPHHVIWLGSPLSGAVASWLLASGQLGKDHVIPKAWGQIQAHVKTHIDPRYQPHAWEQVRNKLRDQVRHQAWRRVRDQIFAQSEACVRARITGQVGNQLWSWIRGQIELRVRTQIQQPVENHVQTQVRNLVQKQIETQFQDQLGAQSWRQGRNQVLNAIAGQHEAGWLSYYDFFATYCNVVEISPLTGLMHVARNAGWWWPHKDVVLLTERPSTLHRDTQGRLHSENGPALAYPDGFAVWALHGIRVTKNRPEVL